MQTNRPIFWYQGLFLQPQHFQLADLHARSHVQPLMESGLPYFWGAGQLDLSAGGLANGVISVNSVSLVFRDGTFVDVPGNGVIKPRSFAEAWTETDRPFRCYVGLKRLSEVEPNVTVVADFDQVGGVKTRLAASSEPEEIRDIYGDGPPAQFKSLRYVLRIFFESELEHLDDYEVMPFAELEREGDTVRLSERFAPPCYTLSGGPMILRMLRDIRDEITGRARQLEGYKSPREIQKAEFDASYMLYLLALRSLNRYVPQLVHLAETPQVHPWVAYGLLRQLVGELSSFSERVNMLGEGEGRAGLPAYDHTDLGRCFTAVQQLLRLLLNELTIGPELLVRLEYRESDRYYAADVPREFFSSRNRFYLVLRSERAGEPGLVENFLREAKIGASAYVPQLIARALPGIELIHLKEPPQGLPRRANSVYFRCEQFGEQWEYVESKGDIALHWGAAPADLRAELVVVKR